ncbi:hypothetical protein ABZ568_00720 [Streptomyces olindensis]|uniref:PE-PGRS family protein n=1 Tax=Streptomyces olindensis TaxID=358823 RepID=A0ABV2XLW9_9ACTN
MAATPPASTPTVAIARVLRRLGLTQGKGGDFRVTGDYRNGERIGTYVLTLSRHADEVIAEHADDIERWAAEDGGWSFRVSVRYPNGDRPMTTVANYGSRVREEPPASTEVLQAAEPAEEAAPVVADEPAHEVTVERPAIVPAVLAQLWADDHRAPVCSPLRDMVRSNECDQYGRPTKAAFERIAAELNALPAGPAALAQLWADDHQAPVCSPLRDMVRGSECDDDLQPTMAAFERIAAEVQALALPVVEPQPEQSGPRALPPAESEPADEEADGLKALRLERAQAEALGWSAGQAELAESAAAGQLRIDPDGSARRVPVPGSAGQRIADGRLAPLVKAGFLVIGQPDSHGHRRVDVTADGRRAVTVWRRWRPAPVDKDRAQEREQLRPLRHGQEEKRRHDWLREEEQRRQAEWEVYSAARDRLHAWEERQERMLNAWATVNGLTYGYLLRLPQRWVPTDEQIAEYVLDPGVVAELRAHAEAPEPKPELPSTGFSRKGEEPSPLEADRAAPEQLDLFGADPAAVAA